MGEENELLVSCVIALRDPLRGAEENMSLPRVLHIQNGGDRLHFPVVLVPQWKEEDETGRKNI
ncbi:hypothetical protein OUZ56_014803 [Daphnia magna]|uniref:Uncharacterized protein n=1 Tax=Daphnia magna TaxID=35525 RepID=A0ABR0AKV9_9CRUS|nr:hypothetical protein OUZ56_014803 [Daphnia magna]